MTAKRHLTVSAGVTIVEQIPVRLGQAEQDAIASLALRLRGEDPGLRFAGPFGRDVAAGYCIGPSLVIEDHSEVALATGEEEAVYGYRALLLAGEGDVLVVGPPRHRAFEEYCRDVVGLGAVEVATTTATTEDGHGLAHRVAEDRELLVRLAALAKQAGGLTVLPYRGGAAVWRLAAAIAEGSACPVRVAAPPPVLAGRVNDKSWFAARVADMLGRQAEPPTAAVNSIVSLASQAIGFARKHPTIAVKLPDSSSSLGNLVVTSAQLNTSSAQRMADDLVDRLRAMGWNGGFPLVVSAWEKPLLASPSAQLWIPAPQDGLPIVEGIFDQLVLGPTAMFSGGAPSSLPVVWQERMAADAVRLGILFQALGYFGRCSFDAIVVGHNGGEPDLHWVECNGRWGGVSIPMTLANRLAGDWTSAPPVILDRVVHCGRPCRLPELLKALGGELYRAGGPVRGAVLMAPARVEEGHGYQAMVLDDSLEASRARALRLEAKLSQILGTAVAAQAAGVDDTTAEA